MSPVSWSADIATPGVSLERAVHQVSGRGHHVAFFHPMRASMSPHTIYVTQVFIRIMNSSASATFSPDKLQHLKAICWRPKSKRHARSLSFHACRQFQSRCCAHVQSSLCCNPFPVQPSRWSVASFTSNREGLCMSLGSKIK